MTSNRLKKGQVDPKHPHATSVRGAQLLKSADVNRVTIIGKSTNGKNVVDMTVMPFGSDKPETIKVVNPALGVKNDSKLKDVFVRLERDEVRFMDMDKLSNALGQSLLGFDYSPTKHVVFFKQYATSEGWNVYKVDLEKL